MDSNNRRGQCMKQFQAMQAFTVKRVIVIEEDQVLKRGIVNYLEMDGYEVTSIDSTDEFFEQCSNKFYTVAILDVDMPDQVGFALAGYLRRNTEMRIITLTKYPFSNTRKACSDAGADVYLEKPVNFRLLSASVGVLFPRYDQTVMHSIQSSSLFKNYKTGEVSGKSGSISEGRLKDKFYHGQCSTCTHCMY